MHPGLGVLHLLALNLPPASSLWQNAPKRVPRAVWSALTEVFLASYMPTAPLAIHISAQGKNRLKPAPAANTPCGMQTLQYSFQEGEVTRFTFTGARRGCRCTFGPSHPCHAAANGHLGAFSQARYHTWPPTTQHNKITVFLHCITMCRALEHTAGPA